MRTIYLRFSAASAALAALDAAGVAADGAVVPVTMTEAGPVYCDVLFGSGVVYDPTGELDGEGAPIMALVPGYHVNLLAPEAWSIPEALASSAVAPTSPACVFAGS